MRRPLVRPEVLGFPRSRRPSRTAPAPAQVLTLQEQRAFLCGVRYSCWGWRRREPPRVRGVWPGLPSYAHALALAQAFYRGYDEATRARYQHACQWDMWPFGLGTPPQPGAQP